MDHEKIKREFETLAAKLKNDFERLLKWEETYRGKIEPKKRA